uniref:Uncharacterized protein n=1 Tax=Trichogramma kaykai TaxID=54128 RepID=A0ABD2XR93_9HYME
MEPSGLFNCAITLKKPTEAWIINNECEMIEEKPDIKNFQPLPFFPKNATDTLQKCDVNHKSEIYNDVKIVFECEEVKPRKDL